MKPETASQQHGDPRPGAVSDPLDLLDGATRTKLSDEQQRVLECLRKQGGGLTARQIQSRVRMVQAAVENALSVLLERQCISRLNTLIPSYAYRVDGSSANDG